MIRRKPLKRSTTPIKRTAVKKARSKPRPGRLKGDEMTAMRELVFERDHYRCQHVVDKEGHRCLRFLTLETGHLAHIRNKAMWGDSPENTTIKCAEHHLVNEHSYGPSGEKPVPKKERPA